MAFIVCTACALFRHGVSGLHPALDFCSPQSEDLTVRAIGMQKIPVEKARLFF
jgi:hypothetical protein